MDGICPLGTDKRRADKPWLVRTGDTLFVGSIGHPDLAGQEEPMAGVLFDSLQHKLLSLPVETDICPGHQAGSVRGAGISGKPSSTFRFEKRFNVALHNRKGPEFIYWRDTGYAAGMIVLGATAQWTHDLRPAFVPGPAPSGPLTRLQSPV